MVDFAKELSKVYPVLYCLEKLDVTLVIELLDYFGIVVFAI